MNIRLENELLENSSVTRLLNESINRKNLQKSKTRLHRNPISSNKTINYNGSKLVASKMYRHFEKRMLTLQPSLHKTLEKIIFWPLFYWNGYSDNILKPPSSQQRITKSFQEIRRQTVLLYVKYFLRTNHKDLKVYQNSCCSQSSTINLFHFIQN